MSLENDKSETISKRIRKIKHYNDILNHGVAELEAVHLRIYSGLVSNKLEGATESAYISLKEKNHKLARAINKSLQDVERTLKQEMENGAEIHNLVQEFVSVLRDSIRIFYDYRTVQEEFNKRNKNAIAKLTHLGNNDCNRTNRIPNESRNPVLTLKRVITTFCLCGAEFSNA